MNLVPVQYCSCSLLKKEQTQDRRDNHGHGRQGIAARTQPNP